MILGRSEIPNIMPKINKSTLKMLPRNNIRIYKFENKQTYFCSFYVGTIHFKSGKFEKSLKTKKICKKS